MTSELVPTDKEALSALLKSGKLSDVVETLSQEAEAPVKPKSAATRRDEMRTLAASGDVDFLNDLEDSMASYVRHVLLTANRELPVKMTQQDVDDMADEYKDLDRLINFLKSRQELMKQRVFSSLDEDFSEQAKKRVLERPIEEMNGKLVSTSGVSFNRERGGRKDPQVDWKKLRTVLPQEAYDAVCEPEHVVEQVIPAKPTEELLMDALAAGTVTIDQVRQALIPGDWNPVAFVVREAK
jgi:hypothetical protein